MFTLGLKLQCKPDKTRCTFNMNQHDVWNTGHLWKELEGRRHTTCWVVVGGELRKRAMLSIVTSQVTFNKKRKTINRTKETMLLVGASQQACVLDPGCEPVS